MSPGVLAELPGPSTALAQLPKLSPRVFPPWTYSCRDRPGLLGKRHRGSRLALAVRISLLMSVSALLPHP